MKTNMLILVIPSLIAFLLLCYHMVSTKGWRFLVYFILSGFAFGFIRARIIHFIQIDLNHSVIPYEFSGKLLRIGDDSLVVYLGWIIVAYVAWQLSEIIIDKVAKGKSSQVFPIISLGFIIIAALSYANETAASVAGWWNWNTFLTSGFSESLFINVPWVGLLDWATVSFEFLAVFLLLPLAYREKKWQYISVLILPLVHWVSHIYSFQIKIFDFILTPSLATHLLLTATALMFWFFPIVKMDITEDRKKDRWLWLAITIILSVCGFADLYYGQNMFLLISLFPILTLIIIASGKLKLYKLFIFGSAIVLVSLFLIKNDIDKGRLALSFFPLIYFWMVLLLERIKLHDKKILLQGTLPVIILLFAVLSLMLGTNLSNNGSAITNHKDPTDKIILITLDTVAANHLNTYGYEEETMPNLDNFANSNYLYKNAYTPVPYTYPAHYSLMTGLYPNSSEIVTNTTKDTDKIITGSMLANLFQKNGYKTAAFIGANVLNTEEMRSGFGYYDVGTIRPYLNPSERWIVDRRSATEVNTAADNWIKDNKNSGFFAWLHYYDAHSPYGADCDVNKFSQNIIPDNPDLLLGDVFEINENKTKLSKNDIAYLSAKYDDGLYCLDQSLGNFLDNLKTEGIYDDATIIIVGDHGENFDHESISHGNNLYQSAIKVPLAIKLGETKQKMIEDNVGLIDIYPTLNALFKLSIFDRSTDGDNVLDKISSSRTLYFQTTKMEPIKTGDTAKIAPTSLAIIEKEIKIIKNISDSGFEIYNIDTDDKEENDMSSSPSLEILKSKLDNFFN